MVKPMEKMETNCRLYQMTSAALNEMALELLMRSMKEMEKNIWRVDYDLLREEIKTSFFYAPGLSQVLMKGMRNNEVLPASIRGAFLLGLVMRNPHWIIVQEEFLSLYGSLQIKPDLVFCDYPLLLFLYGLQHRGELGNLSVAECLEAVKSLETNGILQRYKPLRLKELTESKRVIQLEKARIQWIQEAMAEVLPLVPQDILDALEQPCDQSGELAKRWRVMMDKLQRRERSGSSESQIQGAKKGDQLEHKLLGPLQVLEVSQEANYRRIRTKGLLREYDFQFEKKR